MFKLSMGATEHDEFLLLAFSDTYFIKGLLKSWREF